MKVVEAGYCEGSSGDEALQRAAVYGIVVVLPLVVAYVDFHGESIWLARPRYYHLYHPASG